MKRNGFYLIVSLLSVFCITSCISGNNVQEGQALGVMGYSSSYTPIMNSTFGPVYSPTIANLLDKGDLRMGRCYIFNYTFDSDLPENAQSVVNVNKYYTITLNAYNEIPSYNIESYLTDTSKVLTDEVAILKVFEESTYLEGFLFISQAVEQPSDLQLNWDMSYDYSSMMPNVEDNKNYYDVFVRATKKNTGSASTVAMQYLNAYYMKRYLSDAASKEKALLGSGYSESSSKFTLRFVYVSAIDKDTQAITWKNHPIEVLISSFLDEY
jgi:hypothetical protein